MANEAAIQKIKERVIEKVNIPMGNIIVNPAIINFVQCSVYYVEYKDDDPEVDESDCFFYALVDKDGDAFLYDDGIQAIERLKLVMDERRGFWLRINEFGLIEVIGGIIAISITILFIVLSITNQELPKDIIGIFGIILGYYFGKNVSTR
jgi:hypothetical protein